MLRFKFIFILMVLWSAVAHSQSPEAGARWRVNVKMTSATAGEVIVKAVIDDGWHIYGTSLPEGGPISTTIDFNGSTGVKFTSPVKVSPAPHKGFDSMFNMELTWWENAVTFRRSFTVTDVDAAQIKGSVSYMMCNQRNCMRPPVYNFSKSLPKVK